MQRQLNLVFAGEFEDPLLAGLYVEEVHALPGSSNLIIELIPTGDAPVAHERLLARLNAARPRLRSEIAQAINRKRTPWIEFRIAPTPPIVASRASGREVSE